VQIPDYIINRPSSHGDRFFEALSGPNVGYVFRLRVCNPATEYKMLDDYDWWGHLVPSYRLECFVKGVFDYYSDYAEQTERSWGCISYTEYSPLGVIERESVADSAAFEAWLESVIGPFREVSFQDSGKWSWGQGFSLIIPTPSEAKSPQEPWTVMYEQQFAALFSNIVAYDQPGETEKLVESFMTGYREWMHIKGSLTSPITVSYGVPEDWDQPEFWAGWRGLGEFGELLFDFWARDVDSWWLDTLRRTGYTVALVPEQSEVLWTPESEIALAKTNISEHGDSVREVQTASSSADLRKLLTSHFEGQRNAIESVSDARQILYQQWSSPITYARYEDVLELYLEKLRFWDHAERYLVDNRCRLALVPIRGRSLYV
jgi:hypothetical protein